VRDVSASLTAMVTALMRSLHSRSDPLPLIADPWGERLVPEAVQQALRERMPPADGSSLDTRLRASPAYSNVITRSRYAEDALAEAAAAGTRQAVLIGAGFDSYALRRPPAAGDVVVFEIDHPATQDLKRQCLAANGIAEAKNLHFLAADLSQEGLAEVLARSPFRRDKPAFFSWLGVTMYLPREANAATLAAVAQASAAGSELVFSYIDQAMFGAGPEGADFRALQESVASIGEPFLSGFHPATLSDELGALGFDLLDDLDDVHLVARLDPEGRNGLRPSGRSRIARARVR
jgi:methyltransferase (TIGR00027 family)